MAKAVHSGKMQVWGFVHPDTAQTNPRPRNTAEAQEGGRTLMAATRAEQGREPRILIPRSTLVNFRRASRCRSKAGLEDDLP